MGAAIALILFGAAGTVLPALPGATLVFGGIVLAAWIDDFARIPVWLLLLLGGLTAMAWIVEYAAAAMGAKRAGASRQAISARSSARSRESSADSGVCCSCHSSAPR